MMGNYQILNDRMFFLQKEKHLEKHLDKALRLIGARACGLLCLGIGYLASGPKATISADPG